MIEILAGKLKEKKGSGLFIVQCIILLMAVLTCSVHGLSYWIALKYWLFQMLGVFLPGLAVLLLLKLNFEKSILILVLSYAFGTIILLLEYFLLMPAGLSDYSPYAAIPLSLVSLFICYKKGGNLKWEHDRGDWVICILFLLLVLLIDFFVVSLVNSMPNETGGTGYYIDWLYWAGNNISFTKRFPVQNYRVVGEVFRYHYFSSIVVAQTYFITGINLEILTFYFSFFLPAVLLVFSSYAFFSSLLGKKKFRVAAMILLFFTEGTTVTFADHIYMNPFGLDYGLSYGMLAIMVLITMIREEKFSGRRVLLSALLLAMATGCKGPVALVVLMGFGVTALVLLIGGYWKKGITYGLIWLFSFGMIYLFFVSGGNINVSAERAQLFVGIKEAFYQSEWIQNIYQSLVERYHMPDKILILPTIWLYVYRANKAAVILLLIAVAACIVKWKKKKADLILLSLVAICAWGIFLMVSIIQSGGSQVYFMMAAIPFAISAGLYVMENIPREYGKMQVVLWLVVGIAAGSGMNTWRNMILPKAREGILCVNRMLDRDDYSRYYVSYSDYEAYEWIRENTEEQAVIAVDCFQDVKKQPQEMAAGVFSERFIWNDGMYSKSEEVLRRKKVVKKFLARDKKALQMMKEEGVAYFVQTLSVNPDFHMDSDVAECIFSNRSFKVYQFKNLKNAGNRLE